MAVQYVNSSITVTTTSQTLAAGRPSRTLFRLYNTSSVDMFIYLGGTAATADNGYLVPANGEFKLTGEDNINEELTIIAASGSNSVPFIERYLDEL